MRSNYKKTLYFCVYLLLINLSPLRAHYVYEGVDLFGSNNAFSNYNPIDLNWLQQFLPYNPVILEAGAFRGQDTIKAAKLWPQSRIIAFEPDPYSYKELEKNVAESGVTNVELHHLALNSYNGSALFNVCLGPNNNEPAYSYASSLLPLKRGMEVFCKGPQIEVPCVTLDSWCKEQGITAIDVLHLEVEGAEYQILKKSPQILSTVKALYIKTAIHPHRLGMTNYSSLKELLEKSNFVLLSHWHQPGIIGHAIFLSREVFDAYFKMSLGMYLEI